MSLQPGARLGHYDVVAPLGAGGMGEVYRATDTKLGRDVALNRLTYRDYERIIAQSPLKATCWRTNVGNSPAYRLLRLCAAPWRGEPLHA